MEYCRTALTVFALFWVPAGSSVYPEVIENDGTLNGYLTSDGFHMDAKQIDAFKGRTMSPEDKIVRWMPLTVYMKLSKPALFSDQQILEHIRHLWWKELVCAFLCSPKSQNFKCFCVFAFLLNEHPSVGHWL